MIVREQTGSVAAVIAAAFGRPVVVELAAALAAGDAHLTSLVADDGGAVVGHVQLSRGWLDAADRPVEVAVLSPLSVLPPCRRRGIGAALVRAALGWASDARLPAVFLEGSRDWYPRFGFVPGRDVGCTSPSARIPERAFQAVTLPTWDPAMAGTLIYPDAFWRLDCVGPSR